MESSTGKYRSFHIPAWVSGIVFAMLISSHGYQGNYFEALDPLSFVFIVCLYVLLVMLTVYFIVWRTVVLNRKHPWQRDWVPRLFYQAATAVVLPLFFLMSVHRLIGQVLPSALQQSLYLPTDVYLIVSFLIILNGWFALAYMIKRFRLLFRVYQRLKTNTQLETEKVKEKKPKERPLFVVEVNSIMKGYKDEQIAYFRTEKEMVFIGLLTGEEYFHQSGGLNRMEKDLEERDYMRINRNYMVPLTSVSSAIHFKKKNRLEITLGDAKNTKMLAFQESKLMNEIYNWLLRKIEVFVDKGDIGGK